MEGLRNQEAYDGASIVRLFLEASSLAEGVPPHEGSLVARLCLETITVFQAVTKYLLARKDVASDAQEAHVSLRRSYRRLQLWSDGYGICAGKLDDTFAKSQHLRHATIKLLVSISETLFTRLASLAHIQSDSMPKVYEDGVQRLKMLVEAANDDQSDDGSSSDSTPDYEFDSIKEVAEDLRVDTMCLMDLDPIFQSPVWDVEHEKSVSAIDQQDWAPHNAYIDRIGTRFPEARESLVSRLGKANYERYLRCQEERERQALTDNKLTGLLGLARSEASNSKFHDSGLGSSIPSSASNAETVMSYHGEGGRSVRIPPLPQVAKEGKPFSCVACDKPVYIRTNSAWKRHLYQDLLPWQCLDVACSFSAVFSNRQDWVSHLADGHGLGPDWKAFQCPLCLSDTGSGKVAITKHLGGHLEEISLAALPSDLELDAESESEQRDEDSGSETVKPEDDQHVNKASIPGSSEGPNLEDALKYLDVVKAECIPEVYPRFLNIMKDFKKKAIDTRMVMANVVELFANHPDLIKGFNSFLPLGYFIDGDLKQHYPTPNLDFDGDIFKPMLAEDPYARKEEEENEEEEQQQEKGNEGREFEEGRQPVTFDQAQSYVLKVKRWFKDEPQSYKNFLQVLQKYQTEHLPSHQVSVEVQQILQSAPDLAEEFTRYLPSDFSNTY